MRAGGALPTLFRPDDVIANRERTSPYRSCGYTKPSKIPQHVQAASSHFFRCSFSDGRTAEKYQL